MTMLRTAEIDMAASVTPSDIATFLTNAAWAIVETLGDLIQAGAQVEKFEGVDCVGNERELSTVVKSSPLLPKVLKVPNDPLPSPHSIVQVVDGLNDFGGRHPHVLQNLLRVTP